MSITAITVTGNIASKPDTRRLSSGASVTTFRLASTESQADGNGGWRDLHTTFYTVSCWREFGERVAAALNVGDPVIVHGKFRGREFDREGGGKGINLDIDAWTVGPDLKRVDVELRPSRQSALAQSRPVASEPPSDPWTSPLPSEEPAA